MKNQPTLDKCPSCGRTKRNQDPKNCRHPWHDVLPVEPQPAHVCKFPSNPEAHDEFVCEECNIVWDFVPYRGWESIGNVEVEPAVETVPVVPPAPRPVQRHATETALDFDGEIEFLKDLESGSGIFAKPASGVVQQGAEQWLDTELWNFAHGLAIDLGVENDGAKEALIRCGMHGAILAHAAASPAEIAEQDTVTALRELLDEKGIANAELKAKIAQLEKEANQLRGDLTSLSGGDGFRCGLIHGIEKPFVGGCGEHVSFADSYRCSDCTASFHRDCINKHFELDAYVKSLRELNASGAIKGWKEQVAKAERERDQAREALRNIRLVARTCPDIVIVGTIKELVDMALVAAVPPSEDAPHGNKGEKEHVETDSPNGSLGLDHRNIGRGGDSLASPAMRAEDAPATPQSGTLVAGQSLQTMCSADIGKMSPVTFICRHGSFPNPCKECQGTFYNSFGGASDEQETPIKSHSSPPSASEITESASSAGAQSSTSERSEDSSQAYLAAYTFMHEWLKRVNPRCAENHKLKIKLRRNRLASLLAEYAVKAAEPAAQPSEKEVKP